MAGEPIGEYISFIIDPCLRPSRAESESIYLPLCVGIFIFRINIGKTGFVSSFIGYLSINSLTLLKLIYVYGLFKDGKIVYQEDIAEGLENCPETLARLFEGKNLGKQLLKIADVV